MHIDLDRVRRLLPAIERGMRRRLPMMAETVRRWPPVADRQVRRWLPVVRNAPVPRGAVLVATALTTAAVAAGTATPGTPEAPTAASQPAPLISTNPQPPAADDDDQPAAPTDGEEAPSMDALVPNGVRGPQQTFEPSPEQMANAEAIVATGQRMGLPDRALVIAVATALQESTLHNYGHLGARNDHDSQGLFQQRPSAGWGTPEQITDPEYAATKFYERLIQVPGWQDMPLTEAAQTVQVSAFPDAYAKWEKQAARLVRATHGAGPYADVAHEVAKRHSDADHGHGEHGQNDDRERHDKQHGDDDKGDQKDRDHKGSDHGEGPDHGEHDNGKDHENRK